MDDTSHLNLSTEDTTPVSGPAPMILLPASINSVNIIKKGSGFWPKIKWGKGALIGGVVALIILVAGVGFGVWQVKQDQKIKPTLASGCECSPLGAACPADKPSKIPNIGCAAPGQSQGQACCSAVDSNAVPPAPATTCEVNKLGGPCSGQYSQACGGDGCEANCVNYIWKLNGTRCSYSGDKLDSGSINGYAGPAIPPTPAPTPVPTYVVNGTVMCPNNTSVPAVKFIRFTCPNGCKYQDESGVTAWRCNENRQDSNLPLSLNGACGQVDAMSNLADTSYCGYTEYTCDQARCQGGAQALGGTPTPTAPPPPPTPTPTPPVTSFQCQQIQILRGGNVITPDQIRLNDNIVFRGFASALNTTVSAMQFTVTINGVAQTPVSQPATLVSGQYQADYPYTISQATSYSASVVPVSP